MSSDKHQVPDVVSKLSSAALEFGQRPVFRARRKLSLTGDIFELFTLFKHIQHVPRVIFPVRGGVKNSSGFEFPRYETGETRGDQSALMVALLGPRVGEKQIDSREAAISDLSCQDLDGVGAKIRTLVNSRSFKRDSNCATPGRWTSMPMKLVCG